MNSSKESDVDALNTFEWTHADGVSSAVVESVAAVSGEDPTELEPLYGVVDPDSLDALFSPTPNSQARLDGRVEFPFHGYRIVLGAHGRGRIYEGGERDSSPSTRRETTPSSPEE